MKKNFLYKITIIICVLIIIILVVCWQNTIDKNNKLAKKLQNNNIIGTYMYGNEHYNTTYFSFYDDGTCIIYKQNKSEKTLTYTKLDSYYLISNNNIAIVKNDILLLINKSNKVTTFKKKNNYPIKINTNH